MKYNFSLFSELYEYKSNHRDTSGNISKHVLEFFQNSEFFQRVIKKLSKDNFEIIKANKTNSIDLNSFDDATKKLTLSLNPNEAHFIQCSYIIVEGIPICIMQIDNPNGRDDFLSISGALPPGISNAQILGVLALGQYTRNFPSIICRTFPNLIFIAKVHSGVRDITAHSFQGCENLLALELLGNNIQELPSNLFSSTPNLGYISITANLIRNVPQNLFNNLPFLEIVRLNANEIYSLPHGLFSNTSILTTLSIQNNQLTTIDSRIFGTSRLRNFVILNAAYNNINSIDQRWFESTNRLNTLNLVNNICIDNTFENVRMNRDFVRNQLLDCFENFEEPKQEPFIMCEYMDISNCQMSIYNPEGIEFGRIEGFLPIGGSDDQVRNVVIEEQYTTNIPAIICMQFSNLKVLAALKSRVSHLSFFALQSCHNLGALTLNSNKIVAFSDGTFSNLVNLQFLFLTSNRIERLTSQTFNGLRSLQELHLENNSIAELADGVFNHFSSISMINLRHNRLKSLRSTSFGSSMMNLEALLADSNQINEIDIKWFINSIRLDLLFLRENMCVDQNFENVQTNIEMIKSQLQPCFENSVPDPPTGSFINCNYGHSLNSQRYMCFLAVNNPTGFDQFRNIGGKHLDNHGNENVYGVIALFQNTKNIPAIICLQFHNLRALTLTMTRTSSLTQSSFASCRNLEELKIDMNQLTFIPATIFPSTLKILNLDGNFINDIDINAFAGLRLIRFTINFNNIEHIKSEWFESSNQTLEEISIAFNSISILPSKVFEELEILKTFDISRNHLTTINSTSFGAALRNIKSFSAENNRISSIDPTFFEMALRINVLRLFGNICVWQNFENVENNRDFVRQQLANCF